MVLVVYHKIALLEDLKFCFSYYLRMLFLKPYLIFDNSQYTHREKTGNAALIILLSPILSSLAVKQREQSLHRRFLLPGLRLPAPGEQSLEKLISQRKPARSALALIRNQFTALERKFIQTSMRSDCLDKSGQMTTGEDTEPGSCSWTYTCFVVMGHGVMWSRGKALLTSQSGFQGSVNT